eukprot:31105-Pelagococcus_subviridis.AAC.4
MITIGICTYAGSSLPSPDRSGVHPSNVVVMYAKNVCVMSVDRLIPGHWCCPMPPGKYVSPLTTFPAAAPSGRKRSGWNFSRSG